MQIRRDVLVVLLMGEYPEWRTKKMREAGNTCREARTPRLFSERVLDQIECMQFQSQAVVHEASRHRQSKGWLGPKCGA